MICSCLSTICPITSIPFSTTAPYTSAATAAAAGEFSLTGAVVRLVTGTMFFRAPFRAILGILLAFLDSVES